MQLWQAFGGRDQYLRAPRQKAARVCAIIMMRNEYENEQNKERQDEVERQRAETERLKGQHGS
jgi:hypothetical protein